MINLVYVTLERPGDTIERLMTLKELEHLLDGLRGQLSQLGLDAAFAYGAIVGLGLCSYDGVDLSITIRER